MTGQKWNFEDWWRKRQIEKQQEEKERLNATCPACGADLLDTLNQAIYDWSMGPPSAVTICCPVCGAEIEFSLEWETIINKATIKEVTNDRGK